MNAAGPAPRPAEAGAPPAAASKPGAAGAAPPDPAADPPAAAAGATRGGWQARLGAFRRGFRPPVLRAMLAAQLVAFLAVMARGEGMLQRLELMAHDRLLRSGIAAAEGPPPVVLVVANEDDLHRFGWPLSDDVLARLLERLQALGAGPVGVDLFRDRPVPPGTEALAQRLQEQRDTIWVRKLPEGERPGVAAHPLLAGTRRAVLADLVADPGGVVRRGLLAADDPETGEIAITLGAALAERARGGGRLRPLGDGLGIAGQPIPLIDGPVGPYSVIDAAGYQMMLDFREPRAAFRRLSVSRVLDGPETELAPVLARQAVLVGTETVSVHDSHATPLTLGRDDGPPISGVEIHARTAAQLLRIARAERAAALRPALTRTQERTAVWAGATMGAAVPVAIGAPHWALLALLAVAALAVAATAWAFGAGLLLPLGPVLVAMVVSAAAAVWLLHGSNLRERRRIRRAFEHYLDPRIIQSMVEGDEEPGLGGEQREVTALFTDLQGFTSTSENMSPAELAALLNDYFEGLCDAVVEHGGLVVNFMGDGMVALFGAPLRQPDHADRAVDAALAMDEWARRFAAERAARTGVPLGHTRIGLHSGMAMVGNLGTRSRLHYSAVGDVMNVASRLEGLNGRLGTRICLSAETARRATRHRFVPAGAIPVKGRRAAVAVLVPEQQAELLAGTLDPGQG